LPDRPTDSENHLALPGAPRPLREVLGAWQILAGLAEHQVRRWTSWRRWPVFAMLAHALLAVIAAHDDATRPAPAGLSPTLSPHQPLPTPRSTSLAITIYGWSTRQEDSGVIQVDERVSVAGDAVEDVLGGEGQLGDVAAGFDFIPGNRGRHSRVIAAGQGALGLGHHRGDRIRGFSVQPLRELLSRTPTARRD
jgi:hypothetical protein